MLYRNKLKSEFASAIYEKPSEINIFFFINNFLEFIKFTSKLLFIFKIIVCLFSLFPQLITKNNNDLPFEGVTDDHIGVH